MSGASGPFGEGSVGIRASVVGMPNNDIKVPRRKGTQWLADALANTPRDGQWHLIKTMGVSSAEQTARAYNGAGLGGTGWEFGYRIASTGASMVSELWARWS